MRSWLVNALAGLRAKPSFAERYYLFVVFLDKAQDPMMRRQCASRGSHFPASWCVNAGTWLVLSNLTIPLLWEQLSSGEHPVSPKIVCMTSSRIAWCNEPSTNSWFEKLASIMPHE